MGQDISLKVKGKTHDLNHNLTFSAHTINCVCHSIRSMFRALGIYNFDSREDTIYGDTVVIYSVVFSALLGECLQTVDRSCHSTK